MLPVMLILLPKRRQSARAPAVPITNMVVPSPPQPLARYGWGRVSTFEICGRICTDLQLDPRFLALPIMYPAGNMLIGRTSLLSQNALFFAREENYPCEPVDEDGTFLHAVERIYTLLSLSSHQQICFSLPTHSSQNLKLGLPVFDTVSPLYSCTLTQCLSLIHRCAELEAKGFRRYLYESQPRSIKALLKQRLLELFSKI